LFKKKKNPTTHGELLMPWGRKKGRVKKEKLELGKRIKKRLLAPRRAQSTKQQKRKGTTHGGGSEGVLQSDGRRDGKREVTTLGGRALKRGKREKTCRYRSQRPYQKKREVTSGRPEHPRRTTSKWEKGVGLL